MSRWIKTTDLKPGHNRDIWVYDSILNRIVRAYTNEGSIYNDSGECLSGEKCLLWRPFKKPWKPSETEIIAACVSLEGKRKALAEKVRALKSQKERRGAIDRIACTCGDGSSELEHRPGCPVRTVKECMVEGNAYPIEKH